ncbi:hypothetical protein EYF80_056660 [Liparis tanakae]|uniref:Uncharacterized protein n=1 Tax=Liparis tanakae TaxID=230148 RepID=A0A4Z2EW46_9TELE|nr:hypothetical protein EYF80_056660 [Liparis tanakae]
MNFMISHKSTTIIFIIIIITITTATILYRDVWTFRELPFRRESAGRIEPASVMPIDRGSIMKDERFSKPDAAAFLGGGVA